MVRRVSSTTFVGRTQELAELRGSLSPSGEGALPALFFVAGESGVGKTRLLRELIGRAERDGAPVIGGSCIELGGDELPYAPLVAALRPLHRTCAPVLEQLSESTRAELARLSPEIGEPSAEVQSERGEAQRRLFDAFLELIGRLGEARPMLLWIEDIHWADMSTRSFLRFLAANLGEERAVVVATYRADELHRRHPLRPLLAELERPGRARRIELGRFDRDELADQLTDIVGASPEPAIVERLYRRSDGNPLFTEELLAAGDDGRGPLPPSLREALLLRAEGLSPDSQAVLRCLAVAGRADEALLSEASGIEPAELSVALREALDAQIAIVDDERFAFRHALLGEALYDDLLPGERADLHLRMAAALEAGDGRGDSAWLASAVAHHYHESGDQPLALRSALEAARAVRRLHAYGEAAALLDRALSLWPRVAEPERAGGLEEWELMRDAARAHYLAGEDAIAEALYQRAVETVGEDADPERLASLLTDLASCQWSLGRAEDSRETQRRGLALLPEGDSPTHVRLQAQQVTFLMLQGRFPEVCDKAPGAIEAAARLGMDSERAGLLNRYSCGLYALGREEEGRERMAESIDLAERTGLSDVLATAYNNYADSLHRAGKGAEALAVAEEGLARFEQRTGSPESASRSRHFIHLNLAEILFDLGEWERSKAEVRASGSGHEGVEHAFAQLLSARHALAGGDDEEAAAALDMTEELLRGSLEPHLIAELTVLQAELAGRRGDDESAREAVGRGMDRIQFCSDDSSRMALVAAAGLTVESDAAQRARDLGEEEAERAAAGRAGYFAELVGAAAEEGSGPLEGALVTFAEAEEARARGEDDPALWARVAGAWRAVDRPYAEAIARWRQAQAALARADREAAREALAQAGQLADRLGAAWLGAEVGGLATRARLGPLTPADRPERAPARERAALRADAAGAPGARAGQRGRDEQGGRRPPVHGREDGQRPRLAHPRQARRPGADGGRRRRAPPRDRDRRRGGEARRGVEPGWTPLKVAGCDPDGFGKPGTQCLALPGRPEGRHVSESSFESGPSRDGSSGERRGRLAAARHFLADNHRSASIVLGLVLVGFVAVGAVALIEWRHGEEEDAADADLRARRARRRSGRGLPGRSLAAAGGDDRRRDRGRRARPLRRPRRRGGGVGARSPRRGARLDRRRQARLAARGAPRRPRGHRGDLRPARGPRGRPPDAHRPPAAARAGGRGRGRDRAGDVRRAIRRPRGPGGAGDLAGAGGDRRPGRARARLDGARPVNGDLVGGGRWPRALGEAGARRVDSALLGGARRGLELDGRARRARGGGACDGRRSGRVDGVGPSRRAGARRPPRDPPAHPPAARCRAGSTAPTWSSASAAPPRSTRPRPRAGSSRRSPTRCGRRWRRSRCSPR